MAGADMKSLSRDRRTIAVVTETAEQSKKDQIIKEAMNAFVGAVISDKDVTPTAALAEMKRAAAEKSADIALVGVEAVAEVKP